VFVDVPNGRIVAHNTRLEAAGCEAGQVKIDDMILMLVAYERQDDDDVFRMA